MKSSALNFYSITMFCLLLLCKTDYINAQLSVPDLQTKVDSICASYNNSNSAGYAISVSYKGKTLLTKCYGLADMEHNVPVSTNTVFEIASLSKPITALAVALLVQQNKIKINDEIIKFLPDLPECYKGITIKHLLFHTSGIRDWVVAFRFSDRGSDQILMNDIASWIYRQQELNFPYGEKYSYSNTNYNLLALVIEKVTNKPFPEWMKENIFDPLQMKSTHIHDDVSMIVTNRAESYANNNQGEIANLNGDNLVAYGSSSVFTTIEDLTKWANNYSNWTLGGQEVKEFMFQKGMNDKGEETLYNCNGFSYDHWGVDCVRMSGGWAGYGSLWTYFPEHDLTLVSLSNHIAYDGKEMFQVADLFLSNYYTRTKQENPLELSNLEKTETNTSIAPLLTGNYEFLADPGTIVQISYENDKLYAEIMGEEKFEIYSASDTVLFNKEMELVITYSAKFTSISWNQGGIWNAVRINEITSKDLDKYQGKYYSPELETTYKLDVADDMLYANHYKYGRYKLIPLGGNCFGNDAFYFEKVEFEFDKKNEVIGFRLSVGDLKNLLFMKQKMN